MKKLILSAITLVGVTFSPAAPLVTIGDELDVFFTGTVAERWNSNVLLRSEQKRDDYITSVKVGGEANYGRDTKFKASVKFYEELLRYLSLTNLNQNLANAFLNASYDEAFLNVNLYASWQQLYQNNPSDITGNINPGNQGRIVRRDDYKAGVGGKYDITEKVFAKLGFDYFGERYIDNVDKAIYSDQNMYSVPLSLLYRVTEKWAAGISYKYRYSEFSGGNATLAQLYGSTRSDHFGGLTLDGELLPKLTALLYLGGTYRQINQSNASDEGTFTFNLDLNYEVTEKINTYFSCYRDFGNGSARQSSENTGVVIGANYAITQFIKFDVNGSYINTKYMISTDRTDNTFNGRACIMYVPNKYISTSVGYSYYSNSSTLTAATYNRHIADVQVSLRY